MARKEEGNNMNSFERGNMPNENNREKMDPEIADAALRILRKSLERQKNGDGDLPDDYYNEVQTVIGDIDKNREQNSDTLPEENN